MAIWKIDRDFVRERDLIVTYGDAYDYGSEIIYYDGASLGAGWSAFDVKLTPLLASSVEEARGLDEYRVPDFLVFSEGAHACQDTARVALSGVVAEDVEFLPVNCKTHKLFIFNVTRVVDCLSVQKSAIAYNDAGRIERVVKYRFIESELQDAAIFKIPQTASEDLFCTDRFRDAVLSSRLTGLVFVDTAAD